MEKELLKNAVPLLLEWYGLSKRDLPWRRDREPYHILVSEIMLQQTRVEAVKDYYLRFLKKFPTAEALAAAEEEEVLKAWEGLGYYSRARNLQRAAKTIASEGFPGMYQGVRALPGVGDYTAGAICSIAYDMPCPAVDGNVLRVLSRFLADGRNTDEPSVKRAYSELLEEIYPTQAGDFCQALMELGAIVCLPNGAPLCGGCPWENLCRAHARGEEAHYPVRSEKKARKKVAVSVFVLRREGKYALEKRAATGLLAGMWQFPVSEKNDLSFYGEVVETKKAKHIFTHVEWAMTGYLVNAQAFYPEYVWATAEEIKKNYAVPSAFKAFLPWIE